MDPERPTIRVPFVFPWNQPGARLAATYWLFLRVKAKLTGKAPPSYTVPSEPGSVPPMMRAFLTDPDAPNPLRAEWRAEPTLDLSTVLFVPGVVVVALFALLITYGMGESHRTEITAAIVAPAATLLLALIAGLGYRRWWRSTHRSDSATDEVSSSRPT